MSAVEHDESWLSKTPKSSRKGFLPIALVIFGFTFFTGTMFAGSKIGVAFSFVDILWIAVLGNFLLASYAATLGYISAKSGLNTVLMGRFCFGNIGSKLSDMVLGFAELGWYAWGTATIAISLVKLLNLSEVLTIPLMVIFGLGFAVTAIIGSKGLATLAKLSIPVMGVILLLSVVTATKDVGGLQGLLTAEPTEKLTIAQALTIVFGTFASGATQITNWTRTAKSGRSAIWICLVSFMIGNGAMVLAGAWMAIAYQQADIVEVLILQGLSIAAVLMLCLNLATIQGPTIYNVSAAACHLVRSDRHKLMTFAAAIVGIILAVGGMYEMLIPFLVLLGTFMPPIGGVIMADFWIKHRGQYPELWSKLPNFNYLGLGAYVVGSAVAYTSPWFAPIVGIVTAVVVYGAGVKVQQLMHKGQKSSMTLVKS